MSSTQTLPLIEPLPPITNVQVQTHSRCNADCIFCPFVESEHAASPGRMTDEMWARVLECLQPFQRINEGKFCPYLMQEPLIDKTIFAKIADVYRVFPNVLVEVSTNGAALTDAASESLIEVFAGRRHALWVSHHGIDRDTLQHVMRIDYDRATANLINFLRRADGRVEVLIRGAGQSRDGKHSYFTAAQYRDYWHRLFEMHKINPKNIEVDAFTFHDRAGTLHRTDRGANLLNHGTVREIGPNHPFRCWRVDEWVHVMWDGRIRLCCMDYHGEVSLPSLRDMSLVEYFQSNAYRELVQTVTGRKESNPNWICKRCTSPGG